PEVQNVIFMVGMKFGAAQKQAETWAINTYLPASICQKFSQSKIVAFSTANVYPLTPVKLGGSRESDATGPIGEYAQSALGRERIIAYFSETLEIPCTLIRLSYATELRYGVLLDIAEKVFRSQPIDLTMGHVNTIWQGDANEYVLRSFSLAQVPPAVLNVTGPELVSVRQVAHEFAARFGKSPNFTGTEADTALLCNAAHCHRLFGYPRVPLQQMIEWIAHWIKIGGTTLGKPTHYEVRTGEF
ncbi:MAG: NAD(P)-dependent oxidoreductase, partial [Calditrichaeota bacterium]